MPLHPHKTKTQRRIITAEEWAKFIGKSRHTVRERIKQYNESHVEEYDPRDIFSILRFFTWLLKTTT